MWLSALSLSTMLFLLNSDKLSIYVNGKDPVALRDTAAILMRSQCVEYIRLKAIIRKSPYTAY